MLRSFDSSSWSATLLQEVILEEKFILHKRILLLLLKGIPLLLLHKGIRNTATLHKATLHREGTLPNMPLRSGGIANDYIWRGCSSKSSEVPLTLDEDKVAQLVVGTVFYINTQAVKKSLDKFVFRNGKQDIQAKVFRWDTRSEGEVYRKGFLARAQGKTVYRYEINPPGGILVCHSMGDRNPYLVQNEISFVDGIAPRYICFAQKFKLVIVENDARKWDPADNILLLLNCGFKPEDEGRIKEEHDNFLRISKW
ncbi:hypothetical protein C3L33_18287, partial [Rhododendron williamsianum]